MKHFTYDERLLIQRALTLGQSLSRIAEATGKNRTTVSREIKAHIRGEGKPARSKCKFRYECIFEDTSRCPAPVCTKTPSVQNIVIIMSRRFALNFSSRLIAVMAVQIGSRVLSQRDFTMLSMLTKRINAFFQNPEQAFHSVSPSWNT